MASAQDWFTVDRKGLGKLLERKGKAFVLFELIQNAWDEKATRVGVTLERIAGTPNARLTVEDDNPAGFADLSHAFTLFADSAKKADAERRGRFNLGEKLVLALCQEAEIASTTGCVRFDRSGRRTSGARRPQGSRFTGVLRMTQDELAQCDQAVRSLLAPAGIATFFNGAALPTRVPCLVLEETLPTEIADAEGVLRRTQRKTSIRLHEPIEGETPMLYELGIPVVATGMRWHVDVAQKVPLNFDRDSVPASYLARIAALVVQAQAEQLSSEDANAAWVREAVQRHGEQMPAETVERLMSLRFGERRAVFDPTDTEANHRLVAKGYTLVYGSQLSKAEWSAAKAAGALAPAGQIAPTPKPFGDGGQALKTLRDEERTPGMLRVLAYLDWLAPKLLQRQIHVTLANDFGWPFHAAYGPGHLTINLARVGHRWFDGPLEPINELLLHEFGHHTASNHLSDDYHLALCSLGAKLTALALQEPEQFARFGAVGDLHAS